MTDQLNAQPTLAHHRDIVEVTEADHPCNGERFVVISGCAGFGRRYILACNEDDHSIRTGLRHDHVAIVGRADIRADIPLI